MSSTTTTQQQQLCLPSFPLTLEAGTLAAHAKDKGEKEKSAFIESLVDASACLVELVWDVETAKCYGGPRNDLATFTFTLRGFIAEILRRSRTSYSTLQLALYYLVKATTIPSKPRVFACGRRTFLSALVVAGKYLQDRTFSSRAWSRISGLSTKEINANEISLLLALDWKLNLASWEFTQWSRLLNVFSMSRSSSAFRALRVFAKGSVALTQAHLLHGTGDGMGMEGNEMPKTYLPSPPNTSPLSIASLCSSPSPTSTALHGGMGRCVSMPLTPEKSVPPSPVLQQTPKRRFSEVVEVEAHNPKRRFIVHIPN